MRKKTRNKKIEDALKESETRYRRLFETAHDGILILDSEDGQVTDVNPFLINLLGFSKEEFLNKKLWELGAVKNLKAAKDTFKILQKDGYVRYEDLPLETKEGKFIDVEFVSNSYMAGGKLVIQCNVRDITERKRIDLIKESKRLLEEERSRVASIADTAHELRTPLAIIKGNVDLAMRSSTKNLKSPRSVLRSINHEINHLSSLLSDLTLITSKAWELKNRITYKQVDVRSLIATALKRCKVIAYDKNISITAKNIPKITILGDKMYLEKMLLNLIRNSIIYGNKNGRTIIEAKQSKGVLVIHITDNGIGISKDDLPHVFERFYRAEKYHNSGGNSIGLGLSIVKWVAELHGGEVSVKSIKDKGSVFSISLPIKSV
ncbi:MAG: hypothetical protein A2664_01800 [Candidatus Taylorbacteria bacterium RIFCSPHIGHO2_01_FULL_46_22b]|uniref:histidine kinase n=1 Tax=Candidatus Taylorbacteria bacterium RIFCSPHIGHO2_01_FULL_46_22b TaxID=1802301 RepID=A0A1G2M346_9BACT|nr:MAG: hypothetical protein A2664_01800 [Candidatus Taylorbacteria bacterium RIFCSPHIGHO2_01_FULL_46_22b]